ncbi:nucleotidyltransferase family protein [Rubrivivax gelatinosus]|uniref:Nucleotidyltransferase n=1 Tax=Rubrivivax gelatinosus TaxID=28068 RepID=A0A4V2SFR3_RUBGE|nr:hypothetical protein [Rubrivivax gelatinosus]TCO98357.1 hypothetical protein EV684_1172 [Rubrivivax gelatinosus]
MARDIDKRLNSLRERRTGKDRIADLAMESATQVIAKSLSQESYARRAPFQKHTQYALGAMQAVDPEYTRISLEEAERVKEQLKKGLEKKAISPEFRLQGSVACDIHIRGVSDVDLLVLDGRYIHYDLNGQKALSGGYASPVTYDTLQALVELRKESESILDASFPAAKVKKDGAKAINVSGGSLRRPVDVVPSNWFDTVAYQYSFNEVDRGVHILNKDVPERVLNTPFKHIRQINARDQLSAGGLKKAIRLCKNVKADAINDGTKIELSSYDLASALWHSDMAALTVGIANELAILAEATRFLDDLIRRPNFASTLRTPDGSRLILESDEKFESLRLLSLEMDDLSERVAREQSRADWQWQVPAADQIVEELRRIYIPA